MLSTSNLLFIKTKLGLYLVLVRLLTLRKCFYALCVGLMIQQQHCGKGLVTILMVDDGSQIIPPVAKSSKPCHAS